MKRFIRHGDIILERLDQLPQGVQVVREWWEDKYNPTNKLQLSGETGKIHEVSDVSVYTPVRRDIFSHIIWATSDTKLTHPDHPSEVVPAGIYGVRRVRTYTENAPRAALD